METAENGPSLVLVGVRVVAPRQYPGQSEIDVDRNCATTKFVKHSLLVAWNYSMVQGQEAVEGELVKKYE